jgi:hypothetical protein
MKLGSRRHTPMEAKPANAPHLHDPPSQIV